MLNIAIFQPDIAQNLGTTIRTAACFRAKIHIIEPCGFPFDDKKFKRAGMDYIEQVEIKRHNSWEHFCTFIEDNNLRPVLLSTKASENYLNFKFTKNNILIAGRESAGVPDNVHEYCKNRVKIMMAENTRSLNVAVSIAIVLAEAVRQLKI